MRTTNCQGSVILVAVLAVMVLMAAAPIASATTRVVVTGGADINVWVDDQWDVYPSFDDVVISMRPVRDCFATVFVVDTDGYVHVVLPFSPHSNAWVRGGRTYRYRACELGLDALYVRGIAYVFAVSSPFPLDYGRYGDLLWVGQYGYRVFGDPYVACRQLYASMLPTGSDWTAVSVSCSRFYIGEWARYPHYLCHARPGVHVRVGSYCNNCSRIYDRYRVHVADPYAVIHPVALFKTNVAASNVVLRQVNHKQRSAAQRRAERLVVKTRYSREIHPQAQPAVSVKTNSRVRNNTKTVKTRVVSTNKTVQRAAQNRRTTTVKKNAGVSTRTREQMASAKPARKASSRPKSTRAVNTSKEEKKGATKKSGSASKTK